MRSIVTIAACLLFGTATWAAAAPPSTNQFESDAAIIADKNAHLSGNRHVDDGILGAGETIADAIPIGGLPYSTSGNTCTFTDDYDEVCPYTGSLSGDVVYRYNATSNIALDIDMCTSLYDTKVYVYENSAATLVACNDDAGCGITGYQSHVVASLTGGNSYYIVVDGWASDCGDYDLSVAEGIPCGFCPPDAQLEGEPVCGPDYVDSYNGGCNSVGFTQVTCNTICGEAGNYLVGGNLQFRDTDWYMITVGPGTFTYSGIPNGFSMNLWVFVPDCVLINQGGGLIGFTSTSDCTISSEITFNGPGNFILLAATSGFSGVPCGSDYTLFVDGPGIEYCGVTGACCLPDGTCQVMGPDQCGAANGEYVGNGTACDPTTCEVIAVEPATWGKIKSIYK